MESILYSNGSAIFQRDPAGKVTRVLRAAYIDKVVGVPE